MIRVFLVDDHEVVRRGLIDLLGADPELDVVGEAGSVAEALARIPVLSPDVAVLDVRLPDGNGIELCAHLRQLATGRNLPIAMATGLDDVPSIQQAYQSVTVHREDVDNNSSGSG